LHRGRGDTSVQEGNKMFIKMVLSKCLANETPAYSIKRFGQIEFKEESILIPGFKMKRVNNFLSNDNVSGDAPTLDKSSLSGVNDMRQMIL
jgi:hypothetical protein